MTKTTEMRPSVVKDRIERHDAAWKRMMKHLNKRDELHRKLNEEYGFTESDGSYGIGKKSYIDEVYVSKYDEIENHYRELYEREKLTEDQKDQETLSIFEYLLFDNASTETIKALLESSINHINEQWHDFIRIRARAEIDRWIKEYTIGRIKKMIEHESHDSGYRSVRCKKTFGISRLNISAMKTIFDFKRWYMRELKSYFDSLNASKHA